MPSLAYESFQPWSSGTIFSWARLVWRLYSGFTILQWKSAAICHQFCPLMNWFQNIVRTLNESNPTLLVRSRLLTLQYNEFSSSLLLNIVNLGVETQRSVAFGIEGRSKVLTSVKRVSRITGHSHLKGSYLFCYVQTKQLSLMCRGQVLDLERTLHRQWWMQWSNEKDVLQRSYARQRRGIGRS